MGKVRIRSKNISDKDIEFTVEILDGWSEKLTWDSLINAIYLKSKERYTRQTLSKHARIKNAYNMTKKRVAAFDENETSKLKSDNYLKSRVQKLEAENARLKKENDLLLEQFTRWSYNAYRKGITKNELNSPLPPIDRGQDT